MRRKRRVPGTLVTSLLRQTLWHTGPIARWVAKSWVTPITSTAANNANIANNAKLVKLKCAEKDSISGLLLAVASFPSLAFTLGGWLGW